MSTEYRFKIDAYSPETIPMARLAEYMADLADLLGEKAAVHFVRLESGSLALVSAVEREAEPKVQNRINAVRNNEGPPEALNAFERLDDKLLNDNASARLETVEGARILRFPGREREAQMPYGPFNEAGSLQGQVILVGGRRTAISIHLQDGGKTWLCTANRDIARQLAAHIYGPTVRVDGVGRWLRERDGEWTQIGFIVRDFSVLSDDPLPDVVNELRKIDAKWADRDPLRMLAELRAEDN